MNALQAAARDLEADRQANDLRKEANLVAERLAALSVQHAGEQEESGTRLNERRKARQAQTESIIHSEVDKQRAKQKEEERIAKEEAERLRKEAEKAAAEEQRKKEEAARAVKEAEEAKARAEKEEAARKEAERVEQAKTQALGAQATERNALGMTTPDHDWRAARLALKVRCLPRICCHHLLNTSMQQLKSGPIARVKADRDLKKMWNEIRRKITPRVGQLTNEPQVIANIVSKRSPTLH